VKKDVCEQTKVDGQLAYVMIPFIQANKSRIVRIANDPKKVDALPSARRVRILQNPKTVVIPTRGASVHRLHIDDLLSFQKVRKIRFNGAAMPEHVSEKQFKDGVTRVIGEGGIFKDWGGEYADLYTTRLVYKKRRMAAAFAFKGPGEKRKLVPGRMGKNGDQIQRMFQLDAQIFFAQHWREIEASVATEMYTHAVMKSYSTGNPIYYGIIDGQDSERLRRAYPKIFEFVE
jgi:hypothetical protein